MRSLSAGALLASVAVLAGCGGRDLHARRRAMAVALVPAPQVVGIDVVHGPFSSSDGIGTGFVLRSGRVLTVAHVLGAAGVRARVRLRSPSGEGVAVAARVLSIDQRNDVAVLAATTARGDAANVGATGGRAVVLVIRGGAVRSLPARLRRRILATIRTPDGRRVVERPALELEADIQPGDSGAPVVARGGLVLGMVFAQADRNSDVAYALDARVLPKAAAAFTSPQVRRYPLLAIWSTAAWLSGADGSGMMSCSRTSQP